MFNNFIPLWEKFHEFKSLFEYYYKINLHVELFYSYLLFVTKIAKYIENVLSTVFSVHPILQWGNFLHFHCWPINLSNCLQIVRFSFEVLILQGKTKFVSYRLLKPNSTKSDVEKVWCHFSCSENIVVIFQSFPAWNFSVLSQKHHWNIALNHLEYATRCF